MSNLPVTVHSLAFTLDDMERLALSISRSQLFGKWTPEQALSLLAISQAEGRHPALAARDYDIIQGKPAKKAEAMQRDFLAAGGKIEWRELTDTKASATFSHPMGGSVSIDWDMERARKAGLGGKDMWTKYPRNMLRARCVSEGVRTVYPTATSGMYVPEEVADFREPIDVTPQKRTPPHDPETGEIRTELFQPGPTVADLETRFMQYATEGMERLETEWKALTTDQRVALGAGRGTSGPKMMHWKTIAASVDAKKQAPAGGPPEPPEAAPQSHPEAPQAEPFLETVGASQTDDEARTNIVAQAMRCTTQAQLDQLKENWKPRLEAMPEAVWNATMAEIGKRETELWRASR